MPCSNYGLECKFCSQSGCILCNPGFFISGMNCSLCNSTMSQCNQCNNGSICLGCVSPYIVANGSCVNCPIWPLNNLYYIDQLQQCISCTMVTNRCLTCSAVGQCLSCADLYYLSNNGSCLSCSAAIAFCYSCKTSLAC